MGFLSLVIALLLEQVRPLSEDNWLYQGLRGAARTVERNFNAGEAQQGVLAWLILVLPATLLAWGGFALLLRLHSPIGGLLWDVAVLYLTLGFRQFSHFYTDIQAALANNDLPAARALLALWKSREGESFSAADMTTEEISRVAIEEALIASHRHVFGVFFWFVVLPGPSGAVLYRVADYLARTWTPGADEPFGRFARKAFAVIDWLPVRLTAIGFAIVGNFEDAIFAWRSRATRFGDAARGILIASGAGALGVRLGEPGHLYRGALLEPDPVVEGFSGVDPSPAAMRSAVGLVWRSLVLWMVLLLLLWFAGLFG
jgi:adenosylcobinamide-phosphate synthase